jgi:hypothetical protein
MPTWGPSALRDETLSAWFMRYAATAVSHGQLPTLVTTALNWPQGINLMWNTSLLLPGVLLAPVTLAFGPLTSLTVLLTLGFAGSAASMFWVLRHWGASRAAAAIGGALYGFSPAIRMVAEDHYHLQFAVLPPLIVDAVARLAVGRPGRFGAVRTGIWLGLLLAGQLFVAEEMLVDTALAGVVVILVLAISRPPALIQARTVGGAAVGVITAAAVALALAGHALLVQFHGPLTEVGSPWQLDRAGNLPADFVHAPNAFLVHGSGFAAFLASTGQIRPEYLAYLGWPLLAVIVAAAIFCWRDLRVRAAAVCCAGLEALSLGGHLVKIGPWTIPAAALPWHWLGQLPLLSQLEPNRLSIIADGAAAVVLAFGADRLSAPAIAGPGWLETGWLRLGTIAALAAALVPIVPLPLTTDTIAPVPAGWASTLGKLHLPSGAPVLMLPFNLPQLMRWQAVAGTPYSIVGGYCIAPAPDKRASDCGNESTIKQLTTARLLNRLANGRDIGGPNQATLLAALEGWRPAAVLTAPGSGARVDSYLVSFFGPPTARSRGVLGWRLARDWRSDLALYRHHHRHRHESRLASARVPDRHADQRRARMS